MIAIASDYILIEDYTDAVRWLTLVTQRAPTMELAWYMLGLTEYNANHHAGAERAFLAVCGSIHVMCTPSTTWICRTSRCNRPEDAIAAYKEAISWLQDVAVKTSIPISIVVCCCGIHVAEALPWSRL